VRPISAASACSQANGVRATIIGQVTMSAVTSFPIVCSTRKPCGRSLATRPVQRISIRSKAVLYSADQHIIVTESAVSTIMDLPSDGPAK
jgi:hypothetical protein